LDHTKEASRVSGSDGGTGGKRPTDVGTGDDGQEDWRSRMAYITSSLTGEAVDELQPFLSAIAERSGVIATLLVGHDGLLVASILPPGFDAESVCVWALDVFMNTEHVIKKMGHERVHQILSVTTGGCMVIADYGGGLLVVVSERGDLDSLIALASGGAVTA